MIFLLAFDKNKLLFAEKEREKISHRYIYIPKSFNF